MLPAHRRLLRVAAHAWRASWAVANCEFALRLPPWSRLRTGTGSVDVLRRTATEYRPESTVARLTVLVQPVFWPVRATLDATFGVIRYGTHVKSSVGVGHWTQWCDSLSLAHRMNYSPRTYYIYRFWEPARRQIATSCMQVDEMSALQTRVVVNASVLADKEQFANRCFEVHLAIPPTVVIVRPGEDDQWFASDRRLPARDLVTKPTWGDRGRGVQKWRFEAVDKVWTNGELRCGETELLTRFRRMRGRTLIQHALTNHPEIAAFSGDTLSTFRVMTYREASGGVAVLGVVLKFARVGADVDNLHAGGVACPVTIDTGELGPGMTMNPLQLPVLEHPDTRTAIRGERITVHVDVIALALTAHQLLDVPWSVGWDIAATPDGPVLVEGNSMWGVDLCHVPSGAGLDPAFAECFADILHDAG